jgi:hypothetical protein
MSKKFLQKKFIILYIGILFIFLYVFFARAKYVTEPQYGISFNTIYAQELGLNWKTVYDAIFEELDIKKIRLSAHWNMVEPQRDQFNFSELDYQVQKASESDAEIVFAVGKRLPRWPECHIPDWALNLSPEEQEQRILLYVQKVIERYKKYDAIKVWQVENEPFLSMFAKDHCFNFRKDFLQQEIELVKELDSTDRPILITDSGELSLWSDAYRLGDMFGTTMYVYSWNSFIGPFRNPFLPSFYSIRENVLGLFFGKKEVIVAELALEPWLNKPVIKESTSVQIDRMSPEKFDTVIEFAKKTGMETQYLWGVEWWYYMNLQGNDWYWERGKELFDNR